MSNPNEPMRLNPLSAEDREELESQDGIRRMLRRYSLHDPLTRNVRHLAEQRGLSSEHEAWLLAYHALATLQRHRQDQVDEMMTRLPEPFIK